MKMPCKRSNAKPIRVDPDFEKEMREISRIRLSKGLAPMRMSDLSMREMTHLLRRTEGYRKSLEELKIKPKGKKK